MFGMWEGKVTDGILTGLKKGTEVTTGWYNELLDMGTEQAGKADKRKDL